MRSAEAIVAVGEGALRRPAGTWCVALAAVLLAGLAGCATVGDSMQTIRAAVTGGDAASAPASGRATKTATSASPSAAPVAATQRAFDDATRALAAGRTADAERGFRALLQSNPELGGPHANLGLIQRQAGKVTESASELEEAVRLSPRQPVYLNQLAITYRHLGRFPKAREAYEKAIEIDPTYATATLNLGILNDLYLGDRGRALELYGRYLALSPAGDAQVAKWVAELKNRKAAPITVSRKEKE